VSSVAFSPDGKTLASGSDDSTIKLWDVATGRDRATLQGHLQEVSSVAFSPDGMTLASTSFDKTVKLWDVATGRERVTLQGHTDIVNSVVYSPDGKTLASGSWDMNTMLWDVATDKERATLEEHRNAVASVAFSPDGKTVASGGWDKKVKLWDIPATKQADKQAEPTRSTVLPPQDLVGLWTTLAGEDAAKAYQAIGTLVAAPDQAVPLVKERLRPVPKPNTQEITRWIIDLDSDQFAVRQKATEGLEKVGEQAEAALRQRLTDKPSLDVRQRIEKLLINLEPQHSPKLLRGLRAVEILEYIGNSEAKKVLETLATGAKGATLTNEAKASLERMNKRMATDK